MVATMAKSEKPGPESGGRSDPKSTLNVLPATRLMVSKIAAHRGKAIHEFFEERDVQEFLKHLLLAEMAKEGQRLKGKSPS